MICRVDHAFHMCQIVSYMCHAFRRCFSVHSGALSGVVAGPSCWSLTASEPSPGSGLHPAASSGSESPARVEEEWRLQHRPAKPTSREAKLEQVAPEAREVPCRPQGGRGVALVD